MVRDYLGQQGLAITLAEDVAHGMYALQREIFQWVILDLMLPDGDGLEVCRRIRT